MEGHFKVHLCVIIPMAYECGGVAVWKGVAGRGGTRLCKLPRCGVPTFKIQNEIFIFWKKHLYVINNLVLGNIFKSLPYFEYLIF